MNASAATVPLANVVTAGPTDDTMAHIGAHLFWYNGTGTYLKMLRYTLATNLLETTNINLPILVGDNAAGRLWGLSAEGTINIAEVTGLAGTANAMVLTTFYQTPNKNITTLATTGSQLVYGTTGGEIYMRLHGDTAGTASTLVGSAGSGAICELHVLNGFAYFSQSNTTGCTNQVKQTLKRVPLAAASTVQTLMQAQNASSNLSHIFPQTIGGVDYLYFGDAAFPGLRRFNTSTLLEDLNIADAQMVQSLVVTPAGAVAWTELPSSPWLAYASESGAIYALDGQGRKIGHASHSVNGDGNNLFLDGTTLYNIGGGYISSTTAP